MKGAVSVVIVARRTRDEEARPRTGRTPPELSTSAVLTPPFAPSSSASQPRRGSSVVRSGRRATRQTFNPPEASVGPRGGDKTSWLVKAARVNSHHPTKGVPFMRKFMLLAAICVSALTISTAANAGTDPRICAGLTTRSACAHLAAISQLRIVMSRRAGLAGTAWDSNISCVPKASTLLAFRCSWSAVSKGSARVSWAAESFKPTVTVFSNVCARSLTNPALVPKGCTAMATP